MDTAGVAAVVAIVVVQIDGHLQPRYLWSGKALAATASIQYRLIFGRLFRTHARRQAGKHTGFMHPYSVWRQTAAAAAVAAAAVFRVWQEWNH